MRFTFDKLRAKLCLRTPACDGISNSDLEIVTCTKVPQTKAPASKSNRFSLKKLRRKVRSVNESDTDCVDTIKAGILVSDPTPTPKASRASRLLRRAFPFLAPRPKAVAIDTIVPITDIVIEKMDTLSLEAEDITMESPLPSATAEDFGIDLTAEPTETELELQPEPEDTLIAEEPIPEGMVKLASGRLITEVQASFLPPALLAPAAADDPKPKPKIKGKKRKPAGGKKKKGGKKNFKNY